MEKTMNFLTSMEKLFKILCFTLKMQIQAIQIMGPCHISHELKIHLQKLFVVIDKFLDDLENDLVIEIESQAETMLGSSAKLLSSILSIDMIQGVEEIEDLTKHLKSTAKTAHANTTKKLTEKEDILVGEITECFMNMKQKITLLRADIDRI